MPSSLPHLIVGAGPAGLLAADRLSAAGQPVRVFERRPAAGWKLLVAGSSGLNVTFEAPDLAPFYPVRRPEMNDCLRTFSPADWLFFLRNLGEETYLGSSRRHFVKSFTASALLKSWMERLRARGVEFEFGKELAAFGAGLVRFTDGTQAQGCAVLLALGGYSWEDKPSPWPAALAAHGIAFSPFSPSNAGYSFRAPAGFFAKAEGKPIKGLCLYTARGEKQGELMITKYGLEGTPIYTLGCPGPARLDLKPDLTLEKLAARLASAHGSGRQMLNGAKLSEGAALLFEALAPAEAWENAASLAQALKQLPIELLEPRSLQECISSRGGLSWDELSPQLELVKVPGVFCAGEMVDWDAPTGGFLIQGSVSMGARAAEGMLAKRREVR